jgi:hypothetical protein
MDPAHEDGSDENPNPGWPPAKVDSGEDRSNDRAGPSNGGEVMSKENRSPSGDVVHPIREGAGGGLDHIVEATAPHEKITVELIGEVTEKTAD